MNVKRLQRVCHQKNFEGEKYSSSPADCREGLYAAPILQAWLFVSACNSLRLRPDCLDWHPLALLTHHQRTASGDSKYRPLQQATCRQLTAGIEECFTVRAGKMKKLL